MKRKFLLERFLLLLLGFVCLNSVGTEASGQSPLQSLRPKRSHADNVKQIYPTLSEKFNGEANKIVHVGERLIDLAGGKKHKGDSISYRFNNNQQLIEREVYAEARSLKEKTIYKYDSQGKLILVDSKSYDGSGPYSVRFVYNQFGQLDSTLSASSRGFEIENFRYDELNYLIERKSKDGAGTLWQTTKYSYDQRGNMVLLLVRSKEGDTITVDKYGYNNLNQCIEREHEGEPFICTGNNRWQLKYNKTGDVIQEKSGNGSGRYQYQYDRRRNWTKQYVFDGTESQPHFLTTRTISYRE